MTTKTKYTYRDDELMYAFEMRAPGKLFEATFIPVGEPNLVTNWDKRNFVAHDKAEAVRIAREYGRRIIDMEMIYVYLAPKGGRRW